MERAGLVKELFQLCDLDGDGKLTDQELRPFAELTGYEGGDEEWPEAFAELCSMRKVSVDLGLSLKEWTALINDDS